MRRKPGGWEKGMSENKTEWHGGMEMTLTSPIALRANLKHYVS